MLNCYIRHRDNYAHAYIHQAAWIHNINREELVYARIAGKPVFVKAIAAGLLREYHACVQTSPENSIYLYGAPESKAVFFKLGKTGLVCYYSKKLFDPYSSSSYIIGKDMEFIRHTFSSLLKRKAILHMDKWDTMQTMKDLQLITKLESYNIHAFEILWEQDRVNEHVSSLVRNKQLIF